MPRALILGGTGLIGRAAAGRLLAAGWQVDLTGRDPANMPADVAAMGGRFVAADRRNAPDLRAAAGSGADLLVDCICFTADDARLVLPLASDAGSTVMISSKAVYVDDAGRHSNSDTPPDYGGPIRETQPTMAPGTGDYNSRAGYGANKVAAEHVLMDSGHPVTILRPSKIHGAGALKPNEWVFVKRILDQRPVVFLANRGANVEHTSAAANIAALIELVAAIPGARVLNSADPDAPDTLTISRTIARHLGHSWDEVLLDGAAIGSLGLLPWKAPNPVVLDMTAAGELGYTPAGDFASTVVNEIDWLVSSVLPAAFDHEYFVPMLDYAAEDEYLAGPASMTPDRLPIR